MLTLPRWLRHAFRVASQLLLDAAAVGLAYWTAYEMRFHWVWWTRLFPIAGTVPLWSDYIRILYALIPLWLAIFSYSAELYTRPWLLSADRFLMILKGAVLGTLATLSVSYIYGRLEYSRQMLLLAVPLVVIFVSFAEALAIRLDAWVAQFESTVPILLIGGGKVAELLKENLAFRHPGIVVFQMESTKQPSEALSIAQARGAGEIILLRSSLSNAETLELAEACESAGIGFKMIPDLLELRLGEIQMDDSLGLPAYRIQHTSLSPANWAMKRCVDIFLSSLLLALCAIPFGVIALLIKLDSRGPVLYRQKRLGYKGQTFQAFKFRTMRDDAESHLTAVRDLNDQAGGFFKAKEDPRVTSVGRWLRRFSLDEFPQFINVLKGEMSAVGPRPLAVQTGEMDELLQEFGPTAKKRLNILPGITGLWQISGRSDVSSQQRFALDLFYIEHWSLGLDLQIMLKTIPAMVSGKGAY